MTWGLRRQSSRRPVRQFLSAKPAYTLSRMLCRYRQRSAIDSAVIRATLTGGGSSGSSSARSLSSSSGGSQRTRATDWSAWLEVHSQRGAERARLIRQVSDAGPGSAFLVECQERALVREVVSVQREVPFFLLDADPRVHDVVGGQLRVVREDARGVRRPGRVSPERRKVERPQVLVTHLRVAGADELVHRRDIDEVPRPDLPLAGGGCRELQLGDTRQPRPASDPRNDAHR